MHYYKLSEYLKQRFGCRVYKISLDAGFSCPNKDRRKSREGCIYCDNRSFSYNTRGTAGTLTSQIENGIESLKKRFKAEKFIAYFQAHTNTAAPLEVLKKCYDTIRPYKNIVSLAIGTRPDCISESILDLIEKYTEDYEVWIEYGLQSIHDSTLKLINRRHSYKDFLDAVRITRKRKAIKICAHIIIGLPHETHVHILKTAKALGKLKLDGIKIHPLHIVKGTALEKLWTDDAFSPLTMKTYTILVSEFLEYLWSETVIQRLTADCPDELLVAPSWIHEKNALLKEIEKELAKRDSFQGKLWK